MLVSTTGNVDHDIIHPGYAPTVDNLQNQNILDRLKGVERRSILDWFVNGAVGSRLNVPARAYGGRVRAYAMLKATADIIKCTVFGLDCTDKQTSNGKTIWKRKGTKETG